MHTGLVQNLPKDPKSPDSLQEGTPTVLPSSPVPRDLETRKGPMDLKITSPLENNLEIAGFIGLIFMVLGFIGDLIFSPAIGFTFWAAIPFVLGFGFRAIIDRSYVLDPDLDTLVYRKRFLHFFESQEPICDLREIELVTVRGSTEGEVEENSQPPWKYATLFILSDGTSIEVSTPESSLSQANRLAKKLGRQLGIRYLPGRENQVLEHVPESKLPEVIRSQSLKGAGSETLLAEGLMLLAISHILAAPALLLVGPILWAQTSVLGAAGWSILALLLGCFGISCFRAGAPMFFQGLFRSLSTEEAKVWEDNGFELGAEFVLVMCFANFLIALFGGASVTILQVLAEGFGFSLPASSLALPMFGTMNFLAWSLWQAGYIPLFETETTAKLATPVRIKLLGAVRQREPHCGYCGTLVQGETLVACNTCEAIHHQDCWQESGLCTTYGCGATQCSPLQT